MFTGQQDLQRQHGEAVRRRAEIRLPRLPLQRLRLPPLLRLF